MLFGMDHRTVSQGNAIGRLFSRNDALIVAVTALAYFLAHHLAFLFPDSKQVFMAIWPAGGIGLAALLLSPKRLWPAILAGLFVAGNTANLLTHRPLLNSLGFMTANVIESFSCAWFITRTCGTGIRFSRIKEITALIVAMVFINAATALIGASVATAISGDSFWGFWRTWWIVDGLGLLLVAPLVVSWLTYEHWKTSLRWRQVVEYAAFLVLWCILSRWAFQADWTLPLPRVYPYILPVLLIWTALRFGTRGVVLPLVVLAGISATSPAVSKGPLLWGGQTREERLILLQIYLAFTGISTMLLAASRAESNEAEAAVHRSAERHRSVLQTAMDGFWVMDGEGRILEVNETYCQMSGYAMPELLTMRISDLEYRETARDTAIRIQRITAQGQDRFESQHRRKNGTVFDVEVSAQFRSVDGGRCVTFIRDITERKRAEAALRTSEERHRLILQTTMDGFWRADTQGRLLEVNETYCQMSGYSQQELLAMRIADLDVVENASDVATHMQKIIARSEDRFESRQRRKDGTVFDVEVSVQFRAAEDGQFIVFLRDITERKRAEATVRESERQYRTLADNGQALIWTAGLDKKCNYFNQPWLAFTGRTLEQELGDGWTEGVHPDDMAGCFEIYTSAFDRRERFSMDYRIRHHSGEYRWIQDAGSPRYDSQGNFLGYIGHCLDITERKSLQEQLRQAQKLESVGRLAGGVAHDFNNKLTVILANADLALEQTRADPSLAAYLEEIRKAANRSADLTRQLLAFARKQTIKPEVVDLNEAVTSMLSMLKRLLGENIQVVWQPQEGLWRVKVDPAQIDQILANLCVNARDAIASTGTITIATGHSTFDQDYCAHHAGLVPGEYVRLTVADDGCGMDAETKAHIFEPFFTTKEAGKGTGLGLATVYGIVEQNHGFIQVSSKPGKGTIFTIYLPRHQGAAEAAVAIAAADATAAGGKTILLVEDDASIRNVVRLVLEMQGYPVLAAASPGEALRLAKEHAGVIHLLLSDVIMPEMNGRELAQKLVALRPDLACLFMSGYSADVLGAQGVLDEGTNFLPKPYSPQEMCAKVREVLDRR